MGGWACLLFSGNVVLVEVGRQASPSFLDVVVRTGGVVHLPTVSSALAPCTTTTTAAAPRCLQDYSLRKHLERWWKAPLLGSERVSVADPARYSRRFLAAMQAVLLEGGGGGGGAEPACRASA